MGEKAFDWRAFLSSRGAPFLALIFPQENSAVGAPLVHLAGKDDSDVYYRGSAGCMVSRKGCMLCEDVEVRGHLIDSLILPKVLDEILALGGDYKIQTIQIGKTKTDQSAARIQISAPSAQTMEGILEHLRLHGAEVVSQP